MCSIEEVLLIIISRLFFRLLSTATPAAMSEMEKCMESMILTFHRYAHTDGDGKTLNKKELKKLIETEFPTFLLVRIFHL